MPLSRARFMVKLGLLFFLAGAAVVAFTVLTGPADLPVRGELTVFGAFVVAGSGLLVAWVGWRTLRLASPRNTIARWTVPPDQWARYVAACEMRLAMPGALPTAVPLDLQVGPEGVEVLALKRGFRVGDSFHEIGTLGAELLDMRVVSSPAHMFEFNMTYATGKTSSVRLGVRIPIAEDALTVANGVEDYWIKREPLQVLSIDALRSRERWGWTLSIAGLVLFLGIIALFVKINPPGWAALGPIGALGLAGYGFARGLKARTIRLRKSS